MKSIEKFTSAELAAQCVMGRISADHYYADARYKFNIQQLIEAGMGGFCVFKGIVDETRRMLDELQMDTDIPLIFAADYENGLLMRLNNGSPFPHAMAIGKNEPEKTYEIGKAIAEEMKFVGVHWNFAPVCDINSNVDNPIINIRSFGEDEKTVSEHVSAYIRGLQSQKAAACAKHFPGHGDTDVDSHLALPILNKSLDDINKFELAPFRKSIEEGVKSIMPGHLSVPAMDDSGMPASLSEKVIKTYINDELNYDGIVVTDAMDMKSITDSYSSGEAAIKAINAGANLILLPPDPGEAIKSLTEKADKTNEFKEKLKISANKIIALKKWCGLTAYLPPLEEPQTKTFEQNEKLALNVAYNAVNYHGDTSLIPLAEDKDLAGLALVTGEDLDPGVFFFKMLAQAVENNADFGFIDTSIKDDEVEELKNNLKHAEMLILPVLVGRRAVQGKATIPEKMKNVIPELAEGRPVIAIILGNPYVKENIPADLYIDMYSDSKSSIAASVMALSGRNPDYYQ